MKFPADYTDEYIAKMTKPELRSLLAKLNPFAGYDSSYGRSFNVAQLRATLLRYRGTRKSGSAS